MNALIFKKPIAVLVAIALCVTLTPAAAFADDAKASMSSDGLMAAVTESLSQPDAVAPCVVSNDPVQGATPDQIADAALAPQAATQRFTLDGFNVKRTSARAMADMINDFRTGNQAWFWNADNKTKTVCKGLKKLSYDAKLEKAAIQRAAEIALVWSHTRPNDTSCKTAVAEAGVTGYCIGENISAHFSSNPQDSFILLREDNENYAGQGHRRNMLEDEYNAVGIGFVEYQGRYYCAQEFGKLSSITAPAAAKDTSERITMDVATRHIKAQSLAATQSSVTVPVGGSAALPAVRRNLTTADSGTGFYTHSFYQTVTPTWTSKNTAVAQISGGKVLGKAKGTAQLVASYGGRTAAVTVTVGDATQPMYRMFNPLTGEHFYTASPVERDLLKVDPKGKWNYEGVHWSVPKTSSLPVYRLCNPVTGDHHFTMDRGEYLHVKNVLKWRDEGIGWYSEEPSKGVRLMRLNNPRLPSGAHHYTVNPVERDQCKKNGWIDEGYAWYVCK